MATKETNNNTQPALEHTIRPIDERIRNSNNWRLDLMVNLDDLANALGNLHEDVEEFVNPNVLLVYKVALSKACKLGLLHGDEVAKARFTVISINTNDDQVPKYNGKTRMYYANVALFLIIDGIAYFIGYKDETSEYHYFQVKWFEENNKHRMSLNDCNAIGIPPEKFYESIDDHYADQYASITSYTCGGLIEKSNGEREHKTAIHGLPTKKMVEVALNFLDCCEDNLDKKLAIKRANILLARPLTDANSIENGTRQPKTSSNNKSGGAKPATPTRKPSYLDSLLD